MKFIFSITFWIILLALIAVFIYLNFIWKWSYYDIGKINSWIWYINIIWTTLKGNILDLSIGGNVSSGQSISGIEVQMETNRIIVTSYRKPIFFSIFARNRQLKHISLNQKWIYNIFYKNADWTLTFIKEIEYK